MKKNSNKIGKRGIVSIVIILVLILCAVASMFAVGYYKKYRANKELREILDIDRIYTGLYVGNIAVGGLTKEQAIEKLEIELQEKRFGQRKLILRCANSDFEKDAPYTELGMKYKIEEAVDKAYDYGRDGTLAERAEIQEDLEAVGKYFDIQYEYDMDKIIAFVQSAASEAEESVKEYSGTDVEVDVERTAEMISELLDINQYDGVVYMATNEL